MRVVGLRVEEQGLFLAGSFWDLATPLALVILVWRKGEAIVIGCREKEKRNYFFFVLHYTKRKLA